MHLRKFVPVVVAVAIVVADEVPKKAYCLDAIYTVYSELPFEGSSPDAYWESVCQNPLKVNSMYAAATRFCSSSEISAGASLLNHYCVEYGMTTLLPISNFEANLTRDYLQDMRVIDVGDVKETGPNLTAPVMITDRYYSLALRTISTWESEMAAHHRYGFAVYGFWGAVLAIGMLINASHYVSNWKTRRQEVDIEQSAWAAPPMRGPWNMIKRHLLLPTILGSYHRRLWYGFAVPTRIEALVIAAYWIISIVLAAANINTFAGNLYWETSPAQVWRYLADRTGIMAYANLPLLWMFSGRNNVFLWATGWDYATFNLFHRHIARVATIQAIVHSIAYTVIYKDGGYYKEELAEPWFYLGVMATVAFGALIIFSSILLRKRSYELFLLIHIGLSVVVIVCLFYHTSIFEGEYNPYLWPLVAIWGFDRMLRIAKLVLCNTRLALSRKVIELSQSTATYNKDADIIKIVVQTPNKIVKPKPGQYYYIYRPLSYKGWENHPFTLGSYKRPLLDSKSSPPSSSVGGKETMMESSTNITISVSSQADITTEAEDQTSGQELTFWIRPFDGWTSRLRNKCQNSLNNVLEQRLIIEGPYGHTADLHNYDSVLLISGGTGLSAALPYMEEHLDRKTTGKTCRTHTIDFVWSSRTQEFIHDVCGEQLRPFLTRNDIRHQFFSTSRVHSKSETTEVDRVDAKMAVIVNQGRPDIASIIMTSARGQLEAGSKAGRLAILVCGPASMADAARQAVIEAQKLGCHEIKYIEETFGW